MSGYTKLFSSILDSTIWLEPDHVRLVWITLLAAKDRDGIVETSIPGLARRAVVGVEQCEDAIKRLMAPDPHSRTKSFEGRRVEEIDGGFRILNHDKYRDRGSADEQREKTRERVRRHRERKKMEDKETPRNVTVTHVTPGNARKRHTDTDTDTDTKTKDKDPPKSPKGDSYAFDAFWKSYPVKKGKQAARKAFARAMKNGLGELSLEQLIEIVEKHKRSQDWHKDNGKFIPHPTTWLNQGRWEDEVDTGSPPLLPPQYTEGLD